MMADAVLRFDQIERPDNSLIGGKATGLVKLVQAGLPVPNGFVVTTAAYEDFLERGGLMASINAILVRIDFADPDQLETETGKIRKLIVEASISSDLAASIAKAYEALGPGCYVAVRSSGTAEDTANASFAGLHDTYLHIQGGPSVLDAVRRCWASMWSARAVSYRDSTGFEHAAARIAVVVQEMVDADISGVMFTANPLTARTDELVINASWGLGEGIVSGIVVPDEYALAHRPFRVKRRVVGSKEVRVVRNPASGFGTVTQPVPTDQRDVLCMDDPMLLALGELGLRVMGYHGGLPQDLEWSIADGRIYLLQSRPITGVEFTWDEDVDAFQKAPEDEEAISSGGWAAEFWNGAISPLFYSIRSREIATRNERIYGLMGFKDLIDLRLLKYRRATVFYNLEIDSRLYQYLLPRALRAGALGYHPAHLKQPIAQKPIALGRFAMALARVYLFRPDQSLGRWEQSLRNYARKNCDTAVLPTREELRAWPLERVRAHAVAQSAVAAGFLEHTSIGVYIYSKFTLGLLRLMVLKWAKSADAFAFQDMISGLPVRSMMVVENEELWQLSQQIRQSPALAALIQRHDATEFFELAAKTEEGCRFTENYRAFVQRHGHRGHQDRDIYHNRRCEDPNLDIQSIRLLLKATDPIPPSVLEERLIHRRVEATARVHEEVRRLPLGGLRVALMRWIHAWVLKFLVMRDDWRHSIDRTTLAKKWAYLELGRRAAEKGLLDDAMDCFFLAELELFDLLDGKAQIPLLQRKIEARRKVFLAFQARTEVPPPYLKGSTPVDFEDASDLDSAATLRGTGISRGMIRGRARVVRDIKEIGLITPGDILVCNSTDPAWAPVFPVISGLVLEMGGMLSHGACLSREFGLPAAQIRGAMQRIPNGALVELSGDQGAVLVIDENPDSVAEQPASERTLATESP